MEPVSAIMIGLAGAGKSSFLAALYHVTESETVPSSLILARMPPAREHLERIRRDWLALVPQTRTTSNVLDQNYLEVRDRTASEALMLFFPDLAGEQLAALVEERLYSSEFAAIFSDADRVLLFIHPDKVVESPTIVEVANLAGVLDEEGAVAESRDTPAEAAVVAWEVATVSTQVKLVELLQVANCLSMGLKKIAVVISAWDRVEAEKLEPSTWLRRRLPLLSQYLESHADRVPFRVFGVSAQGGDIQMDKERLANKSSQADRLKTAALDPGYDDRDVSFPVRWLFG